MKVLAVSLLRLGDILMLSPVLKGIKSQHKNVELHVLINSQFSFVKTLMPWVDKFILFDRKQMQKGMGEVDRQLFEPLDRLSTTIDYLNNEKYTKVFNLTHTRLSGILCGLINAEEKLGLAFNDNHTASFGSRWYSYLNEQVGGSDFTAHMTDVHYYGAEIPYNSHEFDFVLDKKGEDEAVALIGDLKNIICVQAFTSDNKKNWGLDRIAKSLKLFQYMNPKYSIFALGAPNESHKVSELIKVCDKEGVSVKPAICSLQGALGILRVSELLLTGDTSIKHLACGTDCKIIEIAIGSSDYRKTGVYRKNNFIVTSTAGCAPCMHSQSCIKNSHICGDRIEPEAIGLLMHQVLNGSNKEIRILAQEYADSLRIHKTYFNHSGFWYARDLAKGFDTKELEKVLNLSSWKLLNRGEHLKLIGEYGSESIKLNATIQQVYPELKSLVKQRFITDLESRITQEGESLLNLKLELQKLAKKKIVNSEEIKRNYKLLESELSPKLASELVVFTEKFNGQTQEHFGQIRKYSEAMQSAYDRNQIQLKLVRTMMSQRMENL